jgi:hypothetical protein
MRLDQKALGLLKLKEMTIEQGTCKFQHKKWCLIIKFVQYFYAEIYPK